MKRSLITVASMTYAIKAKKVLDTNMISSNIVKLPQKYTDSGCAYALELSPLYVQRAVHILDMSGSAYGRVILDE